MTAMIAEVYDALREAGASEEKARAAAEALYAAREEDRLRRIEQGVADLKSEVQNLETRMNGRFTLLQWMIGFTLGLCTAILFKLLA